MGKRPEDLPLDDTPIAASPEPIDARDTGWYKFIVDIEDLLATGQYNWAAETLEGIQRSVEETRRVTPGQRKAVDNIEKTKDRLRGGFHQRRYEGYR